MSVGKGCISIRFKNRICVKMLEPNDYVAMILGHMVIAVLCSETRDWLFSWTISRQESECCKEHQKDGGADADNLSILDLQQFRHPRPWLPYRQLNLLKMLANALGIIMEAALRSSGVMARNMHGTYAANSRRKTAMMGIHSPGTSTRDSRPQNSRMHAPITRYPKAIGRTSAKRPMPVKSSM